MAKMKLDKKLTRNMVYPWEMGNFVTAQILNADIYSDSY